MSRRGRKPTLLFHGHKAMNYIIFRPVHERMRGDARVSMTFTGRYREKSNPRRLYEVAGAGRVKTLHPWIAKWAGYDVYVAADSKPRARARCKLMIFHAVGMKNFFFTHIEHYDKLFLYGNYMRRRLVESGAVADDDPKLVMIGYPKVDCLVDGSLDADKIRQDLGLDPGRPTVMYAPTHGHGRECSLHTAGEEIVRTLADMGASVILKLHDISLDRTWSSIDWVARIRSWDIPNLFLAQGFDSSPYLYVSDVLLTDFSSIGWEFALLDRPTIYYDVPELITAIGEHVDLETWGRKAGTVVRSATGLRRAVERALEDPKEKSEIRRAMVEDVYYKPGTATDRAVARLYELMELDAPPRDAAREATAQ